MDITHTHDSPLLPPGRPSSTVAPLPPECLEIILAFLQHDLASLHHLLFVSRQFFQLTVRVLYKSPFGLAAIADSTSGSPQASSSPRGWNRFLERTKLLSRLLFQNLQIRPLTPTSRMTEQKASILDDFVGLEHIEPLIPPVENLVWSKRKPSLEAPNDWSASMTLAPTSYFADIEDTGDSGQQHHELDPSTDLMFFEDDWPPKNLYAGRGSGSSSNDNRLKCDDKTGLLMDYFYFYTHQDHRSIGFILREIYPGAGRREYDKYLGEIEQAILLHNPKKIESIHIQSPSVVVPYLHAHMEQFELLSTIKLRDPVWSVQELEMVYNFLKDHAAVFPAARAQTPEDDDSRYDDNQERQQVLSLRRGVHGRKAAIRHVTYATSRSMWDDARLAGQAFDPLQFMLALGPGLESIDSVYWNRTELSQLEALDVRSLRSLRIGFVTTPHTDRSFSRPEFLSRCRRLHSLDVFSSSGDMFSWAVQDWNDNKRTLGRSKASTSTCSHETTLDPHLYPWLRGMNISGPERERFKTARPLVRLSHLRIHGPTDHVVFDILRDALYSFRTTLRVLEAVSDIEYAAGGGEWLDHAEELLAGKPLSGSKGKKGSGQESNEQKQDMDSALDQGMDDEDFYNLLPSIATGSLFIRWEVLSLTELDLTGPIASVFNVESLRYMPNLRNLAFSIITYTNTSVARNRLYRPSWPRRAGNSNGEGDNPRRCDMTLLPIVTGPSLRRVMIRGPWPEITDESLQKMIETTTRSGSNRGLESSETDHAGIDDDNDNDEEDMWGNRLYELSIMDNPRVTMQGMIRLAQQMDLLQVMGMSLTLPTNNGHHHFTEPSDMHRYHYRKSGGSARHKYLAEPSSVVEDTDAMAQKMLLKARIKLPWVDLGPEAKHLGRRTRPDGYLSRGWNI
ncbi:hypothetical protein BGZ47_005127 [Haplosporangium gracile]|nr:hypothetical protein BGZ47_005127 [Haplosporangium gracile]